MNDSKTDKLTGLYLITDGARGEQLFTKVRAALQGGTAIVQYRAKDRSAAEIQSEAKQLADLCRQAGALFIINDDPHLAMDCQADGVHLGQQDMAVAAARTLLGPDKIIGTSNRTVEQAVASQEAGADYVAVGSIYPTGSKSDAVHIGLDTLRAIRQAIDVPLVAIGGINRDRVGEVIEAGADSIALISAVMADPAPALAAREIALQFNRRQPVPHGRVLTVAGSDSGGGAGIQADLKTITLLGSYGMSVITALTAQNTCGVRGIHPVPVDFVDEQLAAVLDDLAPEVIKTGMLLDAGIVRLVADRLKQHGLLAMVDPVMIAKGGAPLLRQEAVEACRNQLLPQTYLLTPNLPEAAELTGLPVYNEADMEKAGRRLQQLGARNVLLKGGHLEGEAIDLLLDGETLYRLPAKRIDCRNTHGTGCTSSAAIAALLASGHPLPQAVTLAKEFITEAIRTAPDLGAGHGPVNHFAAAQKLMRTIDRTEQ
ncbi:phosphomethylpyrimidine kinase [Syntrophotalea acetylenivorans]|uniref:Thiamine-phosphate synthase n=1 Tax=Syntrophotalea acetylenivorans TaxID=1842532 RepID=A0A1L3GSD4_9BACT|nr:bifunctional hydroxymethylpyrimidine kinase/phosphomethylpyrimidine kinase [Syntrophotalea acetylenivorans]APG28839.1 phosphomethylpyrimidine kinase [Syntrophotalea acetylenivorans]